MILPLIGQECVITHKGLQVIGTVRGAGVIGNGTYRIHVKSMDMWIDAHYMAGAVRLRSFVFDDGEVYDAKAAFEAKYSAAEIQAMDEAETSTAIVPAPPPPAPPPARVVSDSIVPRLRRRR